jgi:hypothetical protein
MAEDYVRIYSTAPYAPVADLRARLSARLRLSPVPHWRRYMGQRCGVSYAQHAVSRQFAAADEWRLAAAASRAALRTGPTIFARPGRLLHLARTQARGRAHGSRRAFAERAAPSG